MDFFVGLLLLILVLAVVGFLTFLITTKIPMDATFAQIIQLVVVVFCVVYVLGVLIGRFPLPQFPAFGR